MGLKLYIVIFTLSVLGCKPKDSLKQLDPVKKSQSSGTSNTTGNNELNNDGSSTVTNSTTEEPTVTPSNTTTTPTGGGPVKTPVPPPPPPTLNPTLVTGGTVNCAAGHFCPTVSSRPLGAGLCRAGFFCAANTNSTTDTGDGMCQAGFYCPAGSSKATENPSGAGFFTTAGAAEALPCGIGFYCPNAANSSRIQCTNAPANASYTGDKEKNSSCAFSCNSGTVLSNGQCIVKMTSGTYQLTQGDGRYWCPTHSVQFNYTSNVLTSVSLGACGNTFSLSCTNNVCEGVPDLPLVLSVMSSGSYLIRQSGLTATYQGPTL